MKNKGFTLVEMAVVLVIVSAVSGLLLSGFNAFMQHTRSATTHARQVAIKDALIGFLRDNRRLPCPSAFAAPGVEVSQPASACERRGALPYETLRISQEDAQDAWGNYFTYAVSPTWTNSAALTSISLGEMPVAGVPPAAVVIVSHGANSDGAYTAQLIQTAAPTNEEEIGNTAGCLPSCYRSGAAGVFDDEIYALSPQALMGPLLQLGWKTETETLCDSNTDSILLSHVSTGEGKATLKLPASCGGDVSLARTDCESGLLTCAKICGRAKYVCRVLMENGAFK